MRRARRSAWTEEDEEEGDDEGEGACATAIPIILTYDSPPSMDDRETTTAVVSPRGAARIRAGHPWVFRQDVTRGPAADAGTGGPAVVEVRDPRGKPLGRATWAARARLALRMLDRGGGEAGDGDLLALVARRFEAAHARRRALALDRDAYRVVHAESDGLPGLIVDRYADAAVVQTTSVAM